MYSKLLLMIYQHNMQLGIVKWDLSNRPDTFHTTVKQSFTPDSSTMPFTLNQSVAVKMKLNCLLTTKLTQSS